MNPNNDIPFGNDRPALITLQHLNPGDVLLKYAVDLTSKEIQAQLRDRYSHASIYLGDNTVAEASPRANPMAGAIRKAPLAIPASGHLAVFRSQYLFDSDRITKLQHFLGELIARGNRYDYNVILETLVTEIMDRRKKAFSDNQIEILREHFEKQKSPEDYFERPYFCSGLIVACYFAVGIFGDNVDAVVKTNLYLPEDLGHDVNFGHIVGYLAEPNYEVPSDDPFRGKPTYMSQGF